MTETEKLKFENEVMKRALTSIAGYVMPDEMEEDDDGLTEWGCERQDAVEMSYENVIFEAQNALQQLKSMTAVVGKKA